MKTKFLTLALLLIGLIGNAQQLENIASEATKADQNKDKITEGVNNTVEIEKEDISAPNLGSYRSDITTSSDEPLPSTLGTVTQKLNGPVPSPEALEPSYKPDETSSSSDLFEEIPDDANNAVVTSDEMQVDEKTKTIIFRGNVITEIKGSELICENLVIQLDDQNDPQIITATGGIVKFKQVAFENGKRILRLATGHKVVHVVDTEVTTLSGGPPMLRNGDQWVTTESNDAIITMDRRAQRYSVSGPNRTVSPNNCSFPTSSVGRSTIRMPIKNTKKWDKKFSAEKNSYIRR